MFWKYVVKHASDLRDLASRGLSVCLFVCLFEWLFHVREGFSLERVSNYREGPRTPKGNREGEGEGEGIIGARGNHTDIFDVTHA